MKMHINLGEDEIDLHFKNKFDLIDQKLQKFIEDQEQINLKLSKDLENFKEKILTGDFSFDSLDQLKIDYENLKLLLESMENEITSLNVDKLETQVNKVRLDVDTVVAKNNSYMNKVQHDLEGMASIDQVKEMFEIINNEVIKYRSRTDQELDKKMDRVFVNKIINQIKNLGNNFNQMSFIQTKKLGHSMSGSNNLININQPK